MRRPSSDLPCIVAVLVAVGFLPWVVLLGETGGGLVFAFGLVNVDPLHLVTLPQYLGLTQGLPDRLLAWPISVLLYLAGLGSLALSVVGRADARLPAGFLALAGASQLTFVWGLWTTNPTVLPVPVGSLLLLGAAWLVFGRAAATEGRARRD